MLFRDLATLREDMRFRLGRRAAVAGTDAGVRAAARDFEAAITAPDVKRAPRP